MATSSEPPNQPPDEAIAWNAWFYRESYVILHDGLKKLRDRLSRYKSDLETCRNNFDLSGSRFERTLEDVANTIESLNHMIEWGEQNLSDPGNTTIDARPSYGSMRLLKAGGIL